MSIRKVSCCLTLCMVAFASLSYGALGPTLVFRDISGSLPRDIIPGFDHVGLSQGLGTSGEWVWESHPGYTEGYWHKGPEDNEPVWIDHVNGVQLEHTPGSFIWNSMTGSSDTGRGAEVYIRDNNTDRRFRMLDFCEQHAGDRYSTEGAYLVFLKQIDPLLQKGALGGFTCCGLVEAAAEYGGINAGQGFIPNFVENSSLVGLTPESLYLWSSYCWDKGDWAQSPRTLAGDFDPVDFLVTDPLGRRLGQANGETFAEIPNAFFVENGVDSWFEIIDRLPGDYTIDFFGLGADYKGKIAGIEPDGTTQHWEFSGFLGVGDTYRATLRDVPEPSSLIYWSAFVAASAVFFLRQRVNSPGVPRRDGEPCL